MVNLRDRTQRPRPSYLDTYDEEEVAEEEIQDSKQEDVQEEAPSKSASPEARLITLNSDDGDDDYTTELVMLRHELQPFKKRKTITAKPTPKPKPIEQKPFRFLDLPGELRNMVYEYAYIDPHKGCRLATGSSSSNYWLRRPKQITFELIPRKYPAHGRIQVHYKKVYPALLRVSKQVHDEATPILYGQQKFSFKDPGALEDFLQVIGPKNRKLLQSVTLLGWNNRKTDVSENRSAFNGLADATNLKSFTLACPIGAHGHRNRARQLHWTMDKFIAAYGRAKDQADAALDILQVEDGVLRPAWDSHRDEDEERTKVLAELRSLVLTEAKCQRELDQKLP